MKLVVTVKPSAKEASIEQMSENVYRMQVTQPPVKGKANEAVIRALAEHFGVSVSQVEILKGHTGRTKIVELQK